MLARACELTNDKLLQNLNDFGLELYRASAEDSKNIVLSPYSVSLVLAAVGLGTRGETELEVLNAHGLTVSQKDDFNQLIKSLNSCILKPSPNSDLVIANKLFPHIGFPIKQAFLDDISNYHDSELTPIDFRLHFKLKFLLKTLHNS